MNHLGNECNHNILVEMILIDQGFIYGSKEYFSKFFEYMMLSNKMMNILYRKFDNQEFDEIYFEIAYSKNLVPTQWKLICEILEQEGKEGREKLRNLLDNTDRELSELYSEFVSADEFVCSIKSEYRLKYHDE
jgi:hypothetical protein